MTTTEGELTGDAARAAADVDTEDGSPPGLGIRNEALLALEVVALTSFVVARPVLASFGRSAEVFIARGADWADVVAFLLALLAVPPLVLAALGALAGLGGARVRRAVHALVLAPLLATAVWQLAQYVTDPSGVVGAALCLAAGAGLAVLRLRADWLAAFLRYAALGALVFAAQFLFASPASSIVLGGRHAEIDADVTAAVESAIGDDGPPVVVVTLDGLPTNLLLDGQGRIDAELYPNLARLADQATWYRNNTTVAPFTLEAVPAILSGTAPTDMASPVTSQYPHNLFTLLGGAYDVHASEQITALCPITLCPSHDGRVVPHLLRDARDVWDMQMEGEPVDEMLVPGAFDHRYESFSGWIDEQDFTAGDRPDLFFYHLLLPHDGWDYLPDGSRYGALGPPSGLFAYQWGDWGIDVARQRHVLQAQASDVLLGKLFERLRDAGTYDAALVVVTADHGYSFEPNTPMRGLSKDNFDDIMWTPLIVKSPGQDEGAVDDVNITTADVLPTLADELGIDVPWDFDGQPAAEIDRPSTKSIDDWKWSDWRSTDGGPIEVDGAEGLERVLAADAVEGSGPLAVWQRTPYGRLVGTRLDDATVGAPRAEGAEVQALALWDDVDPGVPPLEFLATSPVRVGTSVAITVDGVVAAVTATTATPYGVSIAHALLWPGAVHGGDNDIGMYVLDGPADAPNLRGLEVTARPE
jgi:hypothetical protein